MTPRRAVNRDTITPPSEKHAKLQALWMKLAIEHKLLSAGWRFAVDNRSKTRFGCCYYRKRVVHLSQWHVERSEWWAVEDTLRHEIAHALTRGAKHGPVWKAMAVRLGAIPRSCSKVTAPGIIPEAAWIGTCEDCGNEWKRHNLTKSAQQGRCPRCVRNMPRRHNTKTLQGLLDSVFTPTPEPTGGRITWRRNTPQHTQGTRLAAASTSAPKVTAPRTGGACAAVWAICRGAPNETRQQLLARCAAAGINPATAATQYSKWRKSL